MKSISRIACGLGLVAAFLAGSAGASMTVSGTRVVYPLENRELAMGAGQTYTNDIGGMVEPRGTAQFPIKNLKTVPANAHVKYQGISDFGGALPFEAPITP
ncbi:hypothetical protein LJR034_004987 [Caballeronia sp. LjRoot34]|uniref:fimbrial biogenesis chaperone n=1 Tax=Caballeronia sp. LjRoot34 TaxID=3342325 RepID=UPI003ECDB2D1